MARYFPDLVEQYKEALQAIKNTGGHASMERELKDAIFWMETGYDPAEYRAATRVDAYIMQPDLLATFNVRSIYEFTSNEESSNFTKQLAELFLMFLTDNEKKVLYKIAVERCTFMKIAEDLNISKSTVQSYNERALKKIESVKNILSIYKPGDLETILAEDPLFIESVRDALQKYQSNNRAFNVKSFTRYLPKKNGIT